MVDTTELNANNSVVCLGVVTALLVCLPANAFGDVGLTLNAHYHSPGDPSSGGVWDLAVLSTAGEDVAGVFAVLSGIDDPTGSLTDPSGTHDVSGNAPLVFAEGNGIYQVGYVQDFIEPVLGIGHGYFSKQDGLGDLNWDGQTVVVAGGTFPPGMTPEFDPDGSTEKSFVTALSPGGYAVYVAKFATISGESTPIVRNNLGRATIPGDYNADGTVNTADFTVWRNHLGGTDESVLNGNGTGRNGVDMVDYSLWKSRFGTASVSVTQPLEQVPEPGSSVVDVLGLLLMACWYRVKGIR